MASITKSKAWFSIVGVPLLAAVVGFLGSSTEAATRQVGTEPNDLAWDCAPCFTFMWNSCESSAKVVNAASEDSQESHPSTRTLSISVDLTIRDAQGLLGVDTINPVIYAVLDEEGSSVQWQGTEPDDMLQWYKRVVPGWNSKSEFALELPLDQEGRFPSSIPSIKGYVRAIYVDSLIEIDIPFELEGEFEPEIASDLVFRRDPTMPPAPAPLQYEPTESGEDSRTGPRRPSTAIALYKWHTWVRSKTDKPIMGMTTVWYSADLRGLADYIAVETQLLDSQTNEAMWAPDMQWTSSDGEQAGCLGSCEQDAYTTFDMIRHIIGVHPVEVKIPFVLTDIPVPALHFNVTRKSENKKHTGSRLNY